MGQVPLTNGGQALIDDGDLALVAGTSWRGFQVEGSPIAYASAKRKGRHVLMHRLIAGAVPGEVVDHINGDGLDNRRHNIRLCTRKQNSANRRKRAVATSAYKGVYWHQRARKWAVVVNHKHCGLFIDEIAAARKYDEVARVEFGEFAHLNFRGG